jgi:hypothetical protein
LIDKEEDVLEADHFVVLGNHLYPIGWHSKLGVLAGQIRVSYTATAGT